MKRLFSMLLLCLCLASQAQSKLQVYPAPNGSKLNDDYIVKARIIGGEWKQVDTYAWKVDKVENGKHQAQKTSVAAFDFEGEVEVAVTSRVPVTSCRVRPLSYNIASNVSGNTITFKLDRPRNISVEVNGDIYHNLQIFASPLEQFKIQNSKLKIFKQQGTSSNKTASSTYKIINHKSQKLLYFAPGMHVLPADSLLIPSGTTVYIAGGAVICGYLSTYGNRDIKILGRGIVLPKKNTAGVMVRYSRNVQVDGITTTQMPVGGSDSVRITNCHVLSWYNWGDGFNVFASRNVSYDNIFARTSDDCSTIYCTRLGYHGSCSNIRVSNAVYWADVAHPIMIGLHGDIDKNETIEDAVYEDIDILEQTEKQIDYQGCIGINDGDNILVKGLTFRNIRIENLREGMLLNFRVCYNRKYCHAPGRGIQDITLDNVSYNGAKPNLSIITGYNDDRMVKNITFNNLTIDGQKITDDMPGKPKWYKTGDMAGIFIGEHVENITFK